VPKKYIVSCYYQIARDFAIEAETEEEALELVCNQGKGVHISEEDQQMVDQFVSQELTDEEYQELIREEAA